MKLGEKISQFRSYHGGQVIGWIYDTDCGQSYMIVTVTELALIFISKYSLVSSSSSFKINAPSLYSEPSANESTCGITSLAEILIYILEFNLNDAILRLSIFI